MTVFYRKYRPQTLSELIGQEHVKKTLSYQLTSGKIAHGYLFTGPKGTGKTTTARILAKAVNCSAYRLPTTDYSKKESSSQKAVSSQQRFGEPCNRCNSCLAVLEDRHLDVYEIDAASNRGIDDVRDLREKIKLAPLMGRFKVYIIDEVHMLTSEAFNALLKTLEEPPSHAIFILATTVPEKLPPTIISRTQKFDFRRATPFELKKALEVVVRQEKLNLPEDLLNKIVKRSEGSYRDGLSYLDQLSQGEFTEEEIEGILSASLPYKVANFTDFLLRRDAKGAILDLDKVIGEGGEVSRFAHDVTSWLRLIFFEKEGLSEELGAEELEDALKTRLEKQAREFSREDLITLMKKWTQGAQDLKFATLPQLPLEIVVAEYCGSLEEEAKEPPAQPTAQRALELGERASRPGGTQATKEPKVAKVASPKLKVKVKVAPKAASQSARTGRVTLDAIRSSWPKVLDKLKGNISIRALLARCEVKKIVNGRLVLDVAFKFHKDRLEEEKNKYLLESALREVYKKPIKVDFELKKPVDKNKKVK